jgi:hypothetical protein
MKQENYLFIATVLIETGAEGSVIHNLQSTALLIVTSPGSSMGHSDSHPFGDPLRSTLLTSQLQQMPT